MRGSNYGALKGNFGVLIRGRLRKDWPLQEVVAHGGSKHFKNTG